MKVRWSSLETPLISETIKGFSAASSGMGHTILEVWFLCLSTDIQYLLGLQLLGPRSFLSPDPGWSPHATAPSEQGPRVVQVAKSCAGFAQRPVLGCWRRDVPTDWLQMGTDRGDHIHGKMYRIGHNISVLAVYTWGSFPFFIYLFIFLNFLNYFFIF